jgi:hypothetical protein
MITVILAALAASSALAQERPILIQETRCPFPTTLSIPGGTVAAPVVSEFPAGTATAIAGSVWNQTAPNKAFGHTFHFPATPGECCLMTKGTLTVTFKALQDASQGGANAGNDGATLYSGHTVVAQQQIWPGTASAGATTTLTFPLGANALASGLLSLYVQDDTAVLKAELVVEGCCLSPRCVDTTTDVSTGSNNGAAIAIGATDSHWTVQPPGGNVAQAVAIPRGAISWVVPLAGTQWISSSPTAGPAGLYVYKFNFDLGKEWPGRNCRLSLRYAVDNDMTMQLDGAPPFASTAGLANPFTHFNTLNPAGTQVSSSTGPHVLTVNVTNTSGPTGLLISGKIVCTCKGNGPVPIEAATDIRPDVRVNP